MKLSSIGIFIGSFALLLAIFSFWAGPFSPAPASSMESSVAEKISSIKTTALNALKGKKAEKVEKKPIKNSWNTDKIITIVTAMLGGLALILGVIGFTKSEPIRMVGGAVALGATAMVFPFFVMYAFIILLVVIVLILLQTLGFDT